jgi:hypothetical protein
MNKLLSAIVILGVGTTGFATLRRADGQARAAIADQRVTLQDATNRLADLQSTETALRKEVHEKQAQLRHAAKQNTSDPELLKLLRDDRAKAKSASWTELRDRLGIGWNSSDDYVLVSKRVFKEINFERLVNGGGASDEACALLAITPGEQAAIKQAIRQAADAAWMRMQRIEPSGDIVAHYTIPTPDPAFRESVSNNFAAAINAALGPERSDFFLDGAWRELLNEVAPSAHGDVTMIIRRATGDDGQPKLICETSRGKSTASMEVQYAHYPAYFPILTLFPGGWKTVAEREGFELPRGF